MTREKEIQKEKQITGTQGIRKLILINDDIHTFDFVITALVEVCGHSPEQAEQCAYITHYKGKCEVASGSYDDLSSKRKSLSDRELHVVIG